MELLIYRLADGSLQIMVNGEIAFPQAADLSAQVIALLRSQGLAVETAGPPEQHKPEMSHVHQVAHHGH